MKYETLEKLEQMACKELDGIAQNGGFSPGTAEMAKNLVSMCHKIAEMKDGGMSGAGNWYAMGDYGSMSRSGGDGLGGRNYGMNYGRGMSGMRGRSPSTGRYVSRAQGKEAMAMQLEDMMAEADLDPETMREAERFMNMLR